MSRLRIALLGTGAIAGYHVRPDADPSIALFPDGDAEFVAVMDVDADRARAFAEKFGIPRFHTDVDRLLAEEKPDIVVIATPPAFHASLSIRAMEAGAWVLCEKPLCASLRELDAIQQVEARTGRFCSSVFQSRFGSAQRHVKRLVEERVAGRILVGTCHTTWYRDASYYATGWHGTWKSDFGGPTMGLGIHAMDCFLWTMGDWETVSALAATIDRDIEVEDTSSASVRFANGAVGNILNSALCPAQRTFLRYDFERGSAWTEGALYNLDNDKWRFQTLPDVDPAAAEEFRTIPEEISAQPSSQLQAMVRDFQAGRRPLVSGPEVRTTIEFLSSLYKSAATGRAVERGSIVPGDPFYEHVAGTLALSQS